MTKYISMLKLMLLKTGLRLDQALAKLFTSTPITIAVLY